MTIGISPTKVDEFIQQVQFCIGDHVPKHPAIEQ
jgi:hypothetical protein